MKKIIATVVLGLLVSACAASDAEINAAHDRLKASKQLPTR